MKVLLTGATGYIAQRLLPALLEDGLEVVCCVRDKYRFDADKFDSGNIKVIEVDFLKPETLQAIPADIDAAYYLIHSMAGSEGDFEQKEQTSAKNFKERINKTKAQQVIYLSGIVNEEKLSKHLRSRKKVEEELSTGTYHLTALRAGIIIGSGSASFEIMRDLVEKLPVMITPRWVNTRSQPIAIRNVVQFLKGVLGMEYAYGKSFDIAGPEVYSYKEMLLRFAKVRGLNRNIIVLPVMTPRLSAYWLYLITSVSYKLAVNLVNSMKVEVVARKNDLAESLGIELIPYEDAIKLAFDKIEQEDVLSSWRDALSQNTLENGITKLIEVPEFGCFKHIEKIKVHDEKATLERIWSIGGKTGWYYGNRLWGLRGFIDRMVGGVGLRRGRSNVKKIRAGEALDFWRVIYANREEKRLLLYAEMKLPGEAWLEFKIQDGVLYQTATFRPKGLLGRLYWYAMLPFHHFIFGGMAKRIASFQTT